MGIKSLRMVFAGLIVGFFAIHGAAPAHATTTFWRSVQGAGCRSSLVTFFGKTAPIWECGFVHDTNGISGTPHGNDVTALYIDYSITLPYGVSSVSAALSACGESYNGSTGACGYPTTRVCTSDRYDDQVAAWQATTGLGQEWDYFYTETMIVNTEHNLTADVAKIHGFAAYGSN